MKNLTTTTINNSTNESNSKKSVSIDDIISMAYGGDTSVQTPPQNLQQSNYQVPLNFNPQPPQSIPSSYPGYMVYPQQHPNYGYPQQQYQPQYMPQPQGYGYPPMYPPQQTSWQQGIQFQQPIQQDQGFKAPIATSDYESNNVKANDKLKDKFNFLDDMLKSKK